MSDTNFLSLLLLSATCAFHLNQAIINGHDSPERPFYVLVRGWYDNGFVGECGGTIIAPNVVLTAARCITHAHEVTIIYGNLTERDNEAQQKQISSTSLHLNHLRKDSNGDPVNDVGVVYVNTPFPSNSILNLCTEVYADNTKIGACGYGRNTSAMGLAGSNMPTRLQEAFFEQRASGCQPGVFSSLHCIVTSLSGFTKQRTTGCRPQDVCVFNTSRSICFGDQGGPLYVMHQEEPLCLYGVSSYIHNSMNAGKVCNAGSGFASVDYFYKWIQKHVKNAPKMG